MEQKITPPWAKGLIISLILIVYNLAMFFAGQALNRDISWIPFLTLIIGVIISTYGFAKQSNGNVTFGNVFAHGFKITAAVIVINVIYTFIAFKFIYPGMIDQMQDMARADMKKMGGITEKEITESLQNQREHFYLFVNGTIMLMYGICGAIGSLIGAVIARKNPNYNPTAQSS